MTRQLSHIDRLFSKIDNGIKTLTDGAYSAARPLPTSKKSSLEQSQKKHIAGLMRINHTGEVCAQALYQGQAFTAKNQESYSTSKIQCQIIRLKFIAKKLENSKQTRRNSWRKVRPFQTSWSLHSRRNSTTSIHFSNDHHSRQGCRLPRNSCLHAM